MSNINIAMERTVNEDIHTFFSDCPWVWKVWKV